MIFFILSLCASCAEEDRFIISEISVESNTDVAENIAAQNRWIYSEMKQNYFWSDRMMDSLECDYSLTPDLFFKSLIVDEDRFSYCYPNDQYRPFTKGVDMNASVKLDSVYNVGGKRIGYFYYSGFESEADVTDVILKLKDVDELIIDVRNNPGGLIETCIYLSSLVVPTAARGNLFCSYRYNEHISRLNKLNTGDECTYSFFRKDALTANRALSLSRLFVLTGPRSASCSELLINSLRPYMQVVVIGSTTVGKGVGMRTLSSIHCQYVLLPITFRTFNADGVPVPVTGIVPDIPFASDDVIGEIGNTKETLLSRAILEIINTNLTNENQ